MKSSPIPPIRSNWSLIKVPVHLCLYFTCGTHLFLCLVLPLHWSTDSREQNLCLIHLCFQNWDYLTVVTSVQSCLLSLTHRTYLEIYENISFVYFLKDLFLLRERESTSGSGRGREKGGGSQANSELSTEPDTGLSPSTWNRDLTWAETKSWTPNRLCHPGTPRI